VILDTHPLHQIAESLLSLKANVTEKNRLERSNEMKINCQEHRKTMELFALRRALEKGISDPKELENVKKRIKTLEKELGLD
jgi:hypothetical protein